jgi:cytoskeletal protein CcmA (bactofilin family)
MDFYNKREGKVLASFTGVLVTSNGIQVEGSAYVRKDVQMRALSMDED